MIQILNRKCSFLSVFLLFFLFSCDDSIEFIKYESISGANWETKNNVAFDFSVQDTITPKNLFIYVRNTSDYPFSNIYVITTLVLPDETRIIDTLQYEMADTSGKFLGKGFTDTKENKLYYKEKKRFPRKGNYQFQIRQAMRKNGEVSPLIVLKGIQDIGFSIEKATKK